MAKKQKIDPNKRNPFENDAKRVIHTTIEDEVAKSFMEYSLSVVFSRALPSVVDGLKPVQRRLLYSMHEEGYKHTGNLVKSARPVADTMGNYHPHGDSSIYEALAKMVQPFYMNIPYVEGYGNWGEAGGSGPAAARYTECKLSHVAELLVNEVSEDTVDMKPNYDGELFEPVVLPVRFPTLLINGVSGISVGFATNMPPHNPGEVIDGARFLLKNPDTTVDKLMKYIPGPDFPTGAQVLGLDAIKEAYKTGKGIFRIRAKAEIENLGRGKSNIVFTELLYAAKTETIIDKIKLGIENKKLVGIADVKDLTGHENGTRLVVETKTGVNPNALLLDLYKNTPLEDSFGINNVALVSREVNGEKMDFPETLGIIAILQEFLTSRANVIRRRSQFRLDKREARLHLVSGLIAGLADIDAVIKIVRTSDSDEIAQEKLIKKFKIDQLQAEHILNLQLRRLTRLDQIQLETERNKLLEEIAGLKEILGSDEKVKQLIDDDLKEVKKIIAHPRRTEIIGGSLAEHLEEAKQAAKNVSIEIVDEPCIVSLTHKGGIVRNERAVRGALSKVSSSTRGQFIAISNRGRAFKVETLHVGLKPALVSTILPEKLSAGEKILTLIPLELADGKTGGLAMGTSKGIVKIQAPNWPKTAEVFNVLTVEEDDEILNARWVEDTEQYVFSFTTSESNLLIFPANKVRPQGSLTGGGVTGIDYDANETRVIDFSITSLAEVESAVVVSVSDQGNAKFTPFKLYPHKGRATKGVRSLKMLKGDNEVVYSTVTNTPSLVTSNGEKLEPLALDPRRDGSGQPLGGIPVK